MRRTRNYEDYEGLIHGRVLSWQRSTGLAWEDCLSIANEGFAYANTKHNPEKGEFSTYLWRGIDIHFITHMKHQELWFPITVMDGKEIEKLITTNGQVNKFLDKLMDLSERSQKVIRHILENPNLYCSNGKQVTRSNKKLFGKIAKLGFSWRTARRIIHEIKETLRDES